MDQPGVPFHHIPVLVSECAEYLALEPGAVFLDATVGGAGHSAALAPLITPGGTLIGMDRDSDAIQAATARLLPLQPALQVVLIQSAFGSLESALRGNAATRDLLLDAALFDLGASSHQLDSSRGFAFSRDEPLDMRQDRSAGPTAAELIAGLSERQIEQALLELSDERWARKIARAVVAARRQHALETTGQLVQVVQSAVPRKLWPRRIHVATRTFQTLRILVNQEVSQLEAALPHAVGRLRPGGRLVGISFHSIEDRILKNTFKAMSQASEEAEPLLRILTRKPVVPSEQEIRANPRARSAKLRAAERTG